MANLPDLDDDHERIGRRKSQATAKGGHADRPATASHRDPQNHQFFVTESNLLHVTARGPSK